MATAHQRHSRAPAPKGGRHRNRNAIAVVQTDRLKLRAPLGYPGRIGEGVFAKQPAENFDDMVALICGQRDISIGPVGHGYRISALTDSDDWVFVARSKLEMSWFVERPVRTRG